MSCCEPKHIHVPRSDAELKQLKNRIHRIIGQLNGIESMLEDNRYCGDVLIQIAAVEKALQSFGYTILQEHLETCVTEDVKEGNTDIMEEVMNLVKRLK
ncbi:metal-sensing transcriptional repressor [Absicoccus porci]|jgi:DNA-binding FrmR family transcriptional regulator|uniref:metal-sensing transcriptional repressor n=1 Tax=Absicoccus porci TaxID=2486576 RepID=UPI003D94A3E0